MKRTVSSLSPFGAFSVSMSVTNPAVYLPPSASTCRMVSSETLMDFFTHFDCVVIAANIHHVGKRYAFHRAADGAVDVVPASFDGTFAFIPARVIAALDA